jgi:hypothetical protein
MMTVIRYSWLSSGARSRSEGVAWRDIVELYFAEDHTLRQTRSRRSSLPIRISS